ncbi:Rrf2 family transcriptional regulator [Magnetospirillum gryphiswaldense]|uniref:Rrf2-like transcriptional regulator protein n=1 Tax=Magnetospirillum gryphiswaldense TaxID=55518 RepID=A4U5L9_9PROT|nr:Rrf2 family transcriptional regulator [Magnetospirillum gryphiswaldense]AVM72994.1 Putative HTH-type transcriptional regulator YwnA [Magnetospirillum gryphiswaldense MSR-1]AVM76897.1 Putative HTH-type transcriptional regulator YwnA [Magnetospirillum gryphiswaldense]CAM78176.1 Rrf2-like transcriptional regulator protein [Magnetospirillum gryphiswaldense MSR-1]
MSKNCRFAVAVHTCTLLGMSDGQPLTSDWIAGSVNTNPVVIRRLLSSLAKAGLVTSIRGSNGGSVLAQLPEAITLLDIQRAVDEDTEPALHNQPPNQKCPVGRGIQPVLRRVIDRAEAAREAVLSTTLLAEVITGIKACS